MRKLKMVMFGLLVVSMVFSLIGTGCFIMAFRRPFGKSINNVNRNNKEFAKLIPILRKEAPLAIEKIEIIRVGLSEKPEIDGRIMYTFGINIPWVDGEYIHNYVDDYKIKFSYRYNFDRYPYDLAEKYEEFSTKEIEALNYLFLSDELQLNASAIHFYLEDDLSYHVKFATSDDGWYALGIYYFNSDDFWLKIFIRDGDYVEELGDNYWLVMWFVERA